MLDGDGSVLMHMGALATIGHCLPRNLIHVVLDNQAYESTGGQPTTSAAVELRRCRPEQRLPRSAPRRVEGGAAPGLAGNA